VLVAIARIPEQPEARARAAAAVGLALVDLNRRLAGTLPRVLFASLPEERGRQAAAALEGLGFGVLTCDAAAIPGDDERVLARKVELAPGAFVATDGRGQAHRCPGTAIALLQRGVKVTRTAETVTTSERQFSVSKAVLSGGLVLSTKVEKKGVKAVETAEPFLLVGRADGEPDVIFYERRIDYRMMGPDMQPSSRLNLEKLWTRLQEMAPAGAVDDRLARPGFVAGLPPSSVDPTDLALFLVTLARRAAGQ
jgi:hypothetical protein